MGKRIKTGIVTCILMTAACLTSAYYIFIGNDTDEQKKLEYIEKAEYHEQRSAYITAAEYYEKAVECDPENTELMLKAAKNRLLCRDEEEFEKYCQMAEDCGSIEAYKMEIRKNIDEGDPEKAYLTALEVSDKILDDECRQLKTSLKYSYEESVMCYEDMKGFHDGVTAVKTDGKWGLADSDGYSVCECIFDDAGAYCREKDIFPVCSDDEWYFADINGNRKYVPERKYSFLGAYSDGYAPFSDGKKYGYMTLDYKEKNLKYDFAGSFSDGVAAVSENGKWYLIDSDLKRISDEYDHIQTDRYGFCSSDGMIMVTKNGHTENMYSNGKTQKKENDSFVLPQKYHDGDLFGFKNEQGSPVIDPVFDEVLAFSGSGSACVRKGDSWYVIRLINFMNG